MPHLLCQRKPRLREVQALDQSHIQQESWCKLSAPRSGDLPLRWNSCEEETLWWPREATPGGWKSQRTRSPKWKATSGAWGPAGEAQQRARPSRPSQAFPIDPECLSHTCAAGCCLCPSLSGPGCRITHFQPIPHSFIYSASQILHGNTVPEITDIRANNMEMVSALSLCSKKWQTTEQSVSINGDEGFKSRGL